MNNVPDVYERKTFRKFQVVISSLKKKYVVEHFQPAIVKSAL